MLKMHIPSGNHFAKLIFSATLLLSVGAVQAQEDKFGDDPDKCRESVSLYREYFKQKNYDDALTGWRWAFKNCPASTKNIVINGPTLIGHFIDKHKDDAEKMQAYVDTLMMVYDTRIELYPDDRAYALGRKGMDQFQYATDDFTDTYNTLRDALDAGKNDTEANALLRLYQAAMKQLIAKKLEIEHLFDLYDEVSEVIAFNLAKGEADKSYRFYVQAQEIVDQNFERIAQEDQYVELMRPKVEADPKNAALLEKIAGMMTKRKWTGNPFYLDVSEKLYAIEPTAIAAYSLYEGYVKVDKLDQAAGFLEQAVKLETDPAIKADYLMKQAQILGSRSQFASARSKANEAAGLKPGWGEPYIYIGQLYLSTSSSCGSDECSKAYGYWAAEDIFIKAKSIDSSVAESANSKIAQARKYFPDAKACFFGGIQDGQTVTVGGWIGVETKARFAN